jgi:fumarate reductase subunit D
MIAALLLPVHILLSGIALPLGWFPDGPLGYDRMLSLVSRPPTELYLFFLIFLSFFHCAHRFRHTLYDLGLRGQRTAIAVLCYGAAMIGTVAAGSILMAIP